MTFSASEAAMEGFRIARREPRTVLVWSLLQLILAVASTVVMLPYMRPLMALQSLRTPGAAPPTPAEAMVTLEPMFGMIAVMIPIELVFLSVMSAAVYRAVLRPEDKGLARLRLGGDELRMGILWIELGLFVWAAGVLALLAMVVLGGLLVAATKGSPADLLGLVAGAYVVVAAGMAWLLVRFSMAAPLTFATRHVQLFSAWRLTKGRSWSLFGCYLLTFIFLVMIGITQLFAGSIAALAMHDVGGFMHPDYRSLQAYFTPVRLVALLVSALLGGLYWAVALAPAAVAYQALAGTGERPRV